MRQLIKNHIVNSILEEEKIFNRKIFYFQLDSSEEKTPGWSANGSGGTLWADNWGSLPDQKHLKFSTFGFQKKRAKLKSNLT